jgi:hypothetical protein
MWALVRPKPTVIDSRPIIVTTHLPLQGGGGKSTGKSIVSLVAALALVVVTGGIAGGALAGLPGFGAFTAGSFAAQALAGATSMTGKIRIGSFNNDSDHCGSRQIGCVSSHRWSLLWA